MDAHKNRIKVAICLGRGIRSLTPENQSCGVLAFVDDHLFELTSQEGYLDTDVFEEVEVQATPDSPCVVSFFGEIVSSTDSRGSHRILATCQRDLRNNFIANERGLNQIHDCFLQNTDDSNNAALMGSIVFLNTEVILIHTGQVRYLELHGYGRTKEWDKTHIGNPWSEFDTMQHKLTAYSKARTPCIHNAPTHLPIWLLSRVIRSPDSRWLMVSSEVANLVPCHEFARYYMPDELTLTEQIEVFWRLLVERVVPIENYGMALICSE